MDSLADAAAQAEPAADTQPKEKVSITKLRTKLDLDGAALNDDDVLRAKLSLLDTDGDGQVNAEELYEFLRDEASSEAFTKSEVWVLMRCADLDHNEQISFDEFKQLLRWAAKL